METTARTRLERLVPSRNGLRPRFWWSTSWTPAHEPRRGQSLLPAGRAPLRACQPHHHFEQSFIDGGEVSGDQVLATAIPDRLLHHSSTINIKGESFRLKEKRRAGLLSQQAPENTAAPARDSAKSSGGDTA